MGGPRNPQIASGDRYEDRHVGDLALLLWDLVLTQWSASESYRSMPSWGVMEYMASEMQGS